MIDRVVAESGVFALEMSRAAGVIVAAPVITADAPMRVRAALVVLLALVAHAGAPQHGFDPGLAQLALGVPSDFLVGVAMGLVVRSALGAVETAGDFISPMLGFNAASLFDPHTQIAQTGVTRIFQLLALLLAGLMGVHRVLISALVSSFRVVRPGEMIDPSRATVPLLDITARALEGGVRLALPIVGVLLAVNVGLAFISRAAPTVQIFSVGFGVTLSAGTVSIVIALPDMAHEIAAQLSWVGRGVETVLGALVAR